MPCRSDYMDPREDEKNSKEIAQHLVYIAKKVDLLAELASWVKSAARSTYGDEDRLCELTQMLCNTCKNLTPIMQENIIYDAHNAGARKLATWWDVHQEADRKREVKEAAAKEKKGRRDKALNKLTDDDKETLGL